MMGNGEDDRERAEVKTPSDGPAGSARPDDADDVDDSNPDDPHVVSDRDLEPPTDDTDKGAPPHAEAERARGHGSAPSGGSSTPPSGSAASPARRGSTRPTMMRRSDRSSLRPGGAVSLVGTVVGGRYRIVRVLGEGAMGAVFLAEHRHMRKRLAVKVLHPEMSLVPEVVARFEREAMAAAHIDHPNIAAATDFGQLHDGSFFLVLEYVEGTSLRAELSRTGRFDMGRAFHIIRQIASGLQRAHSLGIVHRDLKPENVMLVDRDGDCSFVKVLDFGIAKVPVGELAGDARPGQPILTQLGMVYGTPEYMAPEQAIGQPVDARADLYALGVIAYELLSGVRPFEPESKIELLGMHVTARVPPMAERVLGLAIPPAVEALVMRLLAKLPSDRYADARALIEAIHGVLAGLAAEGKIDPGFLVGSIRPLPRKYASSAPDGPPPVKVASVRPPGPPLPAAGVTALAEMLPEGDAAALRSPPVLVAKGVRHAKRPGLAHRVLALLRTRLAPQQQIGIVSGVLSVALLGVIVGVTFSRSMTPSRPRGSAVTPAVTTPSSDSPERSPVSQARAAEVGRKAAPEPLRPHEHEGMARVAASRPTEPQFVAASAALDRGEYGAVIAALGPLQTTHGQRAELHRLLTLAYGGKAVYAEALAHAEAWLRADPSGAKDPALAIVMQRAALTKDTQPAAFELLEKRMGAAGCDVLYALAYGDARDRSLAAAIRARTALSMSDVRKNASHALDVTLDLELAQTCEARKTELARAREHGDDRTLALLRRYLSGGSCAGRYRGDCAACMRADGSLEGAIAALEARLKK